MTQEMQEEVLQKIKGVTTLLKQFSGREDAIRYLVHEAKLKK